MKLTKLILIAAALIVTATTGRTQETTTTTTTWKWSSPFVYAEEGEKFRANEFTIDLFGSYVRNSTQENDFFDEPEHGKWGGGIGVNYFFSRWGGIGIDASAHDNGGVFVDTASGSLIARFPIENASMAPYLFGGGGHIFGESEWEGHAGAGLEFRLNQHTGIFADARWIWATKAFLDGSQIRAGLRFAF